MPQSVLMMWRLGERIFFTFLFGGEVVTLFFAHFLGGWSLQYRVCEGGLPEAEVDDQEKFAVPGQRAGRETSP